MLGMTGWNVQMFLRQVCLGCVLLLQYGTGTGWALGIVGFGWVYLDGLDITGYLTALGEGWESVIDDTPVFGTRIGSQL